MKKEYQAYKKFLESTKKRSKKLYLSKLILKYKNNIKKTWHIIKACLCYFLSNFYFLTK